MNISSLENKIKEWEEAQALAILAKQVIEQERKIRVELIEEFKCKKSLGDEHISIYEKEFIVTHKRTIKFDSKLYQEYKSEFNKLELSCFTLEPKLSLSMYNALKEVNSFTQFYNLDRALISTPALPTLIVKEIDE